MKGRRTASAGCPTQPNSDYVSKSFRRKTPDDFLRTSKTPSVASAVESSYTISHSTSSAPARLQSGGDDPGQSRSATTSIRKARTPTTQQRRQTHHRRRSTPEGDHASGNPHKPRGSVPERTGQDSLETASLQPPITRESLSELDLNRLVNDNRLRHDVNFEHEIVFRPNTHARQDPKKKREDDAYFEALAIEFDHYIRLQKHPLLLSSQQGQKHFIAAPSRSSSPKFPQRVPAVISAIREVIQTLVPTAKWQTVDDYFDLDLRMQELEHGICNIAGLFEWTGQLLLCSCSPMRDDMVTAMVAKSQQAVVGQDAHQLVDSIKDLFGVLETMKLVGQIL